ncbi:MAG: glycoside hydrolase family 65 protein [Actinobacteria bacterium]|nr:MAG: glycoside hydrolase family 65 protein [Actinomycetota bacterium]
MITHPAFAVEPWSVRETHLDLNVLAQTESVFALSNGHIGLRANLDEGEPFGIPGTYLNSFYEVRPLPYAEAGYGFPESGQTVLNVTNGKIIRLLVDDEPFDVRYGRLLAHERVLDLRDGVLRRHVEWESPAGTTVRVDSTRLVSFVHRSAAAILYEVEPVNSPLRVAIQSELIANEPAPPTSNDPRTAAILESPLESEDFSDRDARVVLLHSTRRSKLLMAAAMDHVVDGPEETFLAAESEQDVGRVTIATDLAVGERLTMVKFLSYGWSSQRSLAAIRDQVIAAVAKAKYAGWDNLLDGQRAYLEDFWSAADVELEGDTELQQAVRFALFHTLQAGARAEQRAIPAKGLTGPGYDGHTFWDTERFVLPVLTYTAPDSTRDALLWRHSTLDLARDRARQLGLKGAAFPWRTIRGQECSGYWPAGTAAFHISANVADAVVRYQAAVEDEVFELEAGLEVLVEIARLWLSLGHHDAEGRFRIDGVTGPDEYSAIADNNVFTNLLAQRNLLAAADAVARHPDEAADFEAELEEAAAWRDAARDMVIPWDEALGVHPQSEGFTKHQLWDFANTKPDQYPLLLHFPYFDLYRKQVVKQADLVLALHWRGDAFTDEEKARDFAYYEPLTVRDSSLSACTQAIVAAEVGHLELAYDYFGEAALMDLHDLEHNTRDGVHIASLAGAWLAAVAGLGGMRDHDGFLSFAPKLPPRLERLAFGLRFRGRLLKVEATKGEATYTLAEGKPLEVSHYGDRIRVSRQKSVTQPILPTVPPEPAPIQPPGREPMVRQPEAKRRRRRGRRGGTTRIPS